MREELDHRLAARFRVANDSVQVRECRSCSIAAMRAVHGCAGPCENVSPQTIRNPGRAAARQGDPRRLRPVRACDT